MKTFSQRIGETDIKNIIQKESMDERLRNSLWNALFFFYWKKITPDNIELNGPELCYLLLCIWIDFFGRRADEMPDSFDHFNHIMRKNFFGMKWFEVYDFIEFVPFNYKPEEPESLNNDFYRYCNGVLEKELSAFRFINGYLTPISSTEELQSIEMAFDIKDSYLPVKEHLKSAIRLLSDRKEPDYRNSIKESISAIESYCSILTSNSKATLGQALKVIKKKNKIHPALEKAFSNLYGYTSDENGIRHKLLEENNLKQEDANFMLVVCSAFINYLKQKEINEGTNE